MSKILKAMIIGTGGIAPIHIEGFLEFKDKVEIVAVAGFSSLSRAQKLVDDYKLNARATCDYKEFLDEVDIVAICTPPSSHMEIACTCLDKNINVLLEKPMAPSLEECDLILESARRSKAVLSVVSQSRFTTSIWKTIKLLHKGDYGKVLHTNVNSLWWRGKNYYDLAWRGRWDTEGGGCTLNHAVHHIDLLIWAKGLPVEVYSVMDNLAHGNSEVEDISISILKFSDGSLGQITASLVNHGEKQNINFQMEKASLSIPFDLATSKQRGNGFPIEDEETKDKLLNDYKDLPDLEYELHTGQIEEFINCIQKGEKPLVGGENGRETIELITGIYKSACLKQSIKLPLSESDDFYSREGILRNVPRFNEKVNYIDSYDDKSITTFKGKY